MTDFRVPFLILDLEDFLLITFFLTERFAGASTVTTLPRLTIYLFTFGPTRLFCIVEVKLSLKPVRRAAPLAVVFLLLPDLDLNSLLRPVPNEQVVPPNFFLLRGLPLDVTR